MSLNWYNEFLKKKDILASLPNNYTVAQGKKAELKPYYVVTIVHDMDEPVERLKNVRVWASSGERARRKFLEEYSFLVDYLSMGRDVEARYDPVAWEEKLQQEKRQQQQHEEREQSIQEMWWNND